MKWVLYGVLIFDAILMLALWLKYRRRRRDDSDG